MVIGKIVYGPSQFTLQWIHSNSVRSAHNQHGAAVCGTNMKIKLYVNNFQEESLIINADSSKGKSKQYLAAGTFNENVIKEFSLQTTKWCIAYPADFSASLFLLVH